MRFVMTFDDTLRDASSFGRKFIVSIKFSVLLVLFKLRG